MKATDLLKKDHEVVRGLLSTFEDSTDQPDQKRSALAQQICNELKVHAAIEEEIFYPAVKSIRDKEAKAEVKEALEEHIQIKASVAKISKMKRDDDRLFSATMKALKEEVERR